MIMIIIELIGNGASFTNRFSSDPFDPLRIIISARAMDYINPEEYQPAPLDLLDLLDDSPLHQHHIPTCFDSSEEDEIQVFSIPPSPTSARTRRTKAQKQGKIRTSRNSQKVYHNILKHWLEHRQLEAFANKYNKYFNQRIYFVLILHEIVRTQEGIRFLEAYQQQAAEVCKKKQSEILTIKREKPSCQQIDHLQRVIQEINYSVEACREFARGNIMEAITVVFRRHQKRITKIKEFENALSIFEMETGYAPENLIS